MQLEMTRKRYLHDRMRRTMEIWLAKMGENEGVQEAISLQHGAVDNVATMRLKPWDETWTYELWSRKTRRLYSN